MTERELIQEIASQTGEEFQTIQSMGFNVLRETLPFEERQEPLIVDWDELDNERRIRVAC